MNLPPEDNLRKEDKGSAPKVSFSNNSENYIAINKVFSLAIKPLYCMYFNGGALR